MSKQDKVLELIKLEEERQSNTLMMIPSENYTYPEVRQAVGSVLMHKYSEGYVGARYYQGNKIIDEIERIAIDRAKNLFKTPYANVQPYSGSPANAAIYFGLLNPGDLIMGMQLKVGGHLTHGHPDITFSGKYFKSVQFGVDENGIIDYEEVENMALTEKPKLLMVGTTAYPLAFDWKRFSEIAEKIDAWLVADISHVAGLVAAGVYPSPFGLAHVVMSTTHKTLRGPRGAVIWVTDKGLAKNRDLPKIIDRAVFPGLQGGPHNNTTAGIAIALEKAASEEFKKYGQQVVANAKIIAQELKNGGLKLVSGGTECHLVLIDLQPLGLSGNILAEALEVAGVVVNRNSVPNDTMPPFYPSGIRLGTPAITTRGMGEKEMVMISGWILKVADYVKNNKLPADPAKRSDYIKSFKETIANDKFLLNIGKEVKKLCLEFPVK